MKRVLVTGALGYIGSVLTPYLKKHNFECAGYDTGFFRNCTLYPADDAETTLADMRGFNAEFLKDIDAVVHLAGISNDPFGNLTKEKVYDPSRDYSLKLAQLCKERKIKFIFASSCSVYGKGDGSLLDEDSPLYPQTPYSVNKLEIEQGLLKIADESFSPVILRFATVFGLSSRIRFDVVVNMLTAMAFTTKKILLNSDGKAWRPSVHIDDVCLAVKYAIDYDAKGKGAMILNVGGTKENHKIIDIANIVKDAVDGSEIVFMNVKDKTKFTEEEELIRDRKVQDGVDTRTYKVSFEKIKGDFRGFECQYNVNEGIKSLLKKFEEIEFTEADFKNPNYYRLQTMEKLHNTKMIDNDLFWIERG